MIKHVSKLLLEKKPVTIAYFGGSITQGAGVSDKQNDCYRNKVTKWFKTTYPDSEITEVDASLGGTGSDLGLFRMDREVIDKKPDLVFIEFAVNDTCVDECEPFEETIIRKILDSNIETDIVLLVMMNEKMYLKSLNGEYDDSLVFYAELASKYGIDIIYSHKGVTDRIDNGEGDFLTYTNDHVHPNILGYDCLAKYIIKELKKIIYPSPIICDKIYLDAEFVDATSISDTDFEKSNVSFLNSNGHLFSCEKGKYVNYEFEGSFIGIVYRMESDSGILEYRLDDGETKKIGLFDEYTVRFDRTSYTIIDKNLKKGKHTLKITVTGEKSEKSNGTNVRIIAFLCA